MLYSHGQPYSEAIKDLDCSRSLFRHSTFLPGMVFFLVCQLQHGNTNLANKRGGPPNMVDTQKSPLSGLIRATEASAVYLLPYPEIDVYLALLLVPSPYRHITPHRTSP